MSLEPESSVLTFLRSRTLFPPLPRVCCGVLSALLLLAPAAQGAPARSKTSRSSKSSSSKAPPAPSSTSEAQPAPAKETRAAQESRPVAETRSAPASRSTPAARSTPEATPAAAPAASGPLRVGVGGDLFFESARMTGVQGINASRRDESFDYSTGFLSATAWLSTPVPSVSERLRVGAGLRIFGNYAAGGGRQFGFGLLNEAFVNGEYGLPVADKTEVIFGGRAGLAFLVPGRELSEEILRLQEQGVHVWNVPRVGWLLGPSVGARRRMSERIWLRADLIAHIEQMYLFATSQEISGLRFTKHWSTLGLRLGLNLGAEFAL